MADQRLAIVNPHPKRLPGPQLLHDFALQKHVDASDNPCSAIDFLSASGQRTQLSYSELNSRSDQLAATLLSRFAKHGILHQDRIIVPVFLSQSPELYVSLLAILKAGAGFCPQALDAPEDRLKFVFQDVGAKVLLTTTHLRASIPQVDGLDVLCIDDKEYLNQDFKGIKRGTSPQAPAYILYTSGSTGTPKGVVLSHDAVTQSLLAHDSVIPPFSRFLQFASPTFDVSMFEIFFTLFRGATLVACDRKKLLNDLPGVLNEMDVDGAELTPTVAGSLLGNREQVPGLKVLLTIGEMLTRHVIDEFGATDDKGGLLQGMYGPTEAAIHCTLQTDFKAGAKAGLIGLPLATVSAFVIASPADCGDDPTVIKILKVGQVGELAVGGHQLADGYLNRPEQTKAAFIPTSEHGTLYRTGDKARLLEDGTLECLGRISSGQIKLRGMRMELGEIEHAAATAKGCRVTVASVLNQNLVVFCLTDGHTASQTILDACKKWLPSYMMPNDIVLKTELPQLPSGKIDRKKLDAEYLEASKEETAGQDENLDKEEQAAADALQTALGATVTLSVNLSHVGLDSLSSIRVASILRRNGYDVGAVDILSTRNLASLGKLLRDNVTSEEASSNIQEPQSYESLKSTILQSALLRNRQDTIQRVLPCTPVQASMLAETKQDASAYCNWIHIGFDKSVTLDRARYAILQVVQSNECFRTGFAASDSVKSGFVQVVFTSIVEPTIHSVQEFSYDFHLSSDDEFLRPMQAQILQQAQTTELLIQMHHGLYDGWSVDLLINDLNEILGSPVAKVPVRPQFASVVDFYQNISSQPQEQSERYWKSVLRGYTPTRLPRLLSDSHPVSELSNVSCNIALSTDSLRSKLPQGCHPQSLFQAALSYLLSCYLGKQDILFGTVTSGRTIPVTDIEEIMGPCMATLPLRVDVDQDGDVRKLLKALSSSTTAMLSHSLLPLQQIKALSGVLPGQSFFDVLFIWQESLQTRLQSHRNARLKGSKDNLEFNLVFEVEPHSKGITLKLSYKTSLWSADYATLFLKQVEAVAHQIVQNDEQLLSQLACSMPCQALSTPLLPTTVSLQQTFSQLSIPKDAALVLAHVSGEACQPVPRGAVGQVCWTRFKGSFESGSEMKRALSTLEPTRLFGRMLMDSSIALVDNESANQEIKISPDEIAEITASLESFPHAQTALAAFVAKKQGSGSLAAFWIPSGASSLNVAALELTSNLTSAIGRLYDHLLVRLPPHLIPKSLIPVSKLPSQEECNSFYSNLSASYLDSISHAQVEAGNSDEWSGLELRIASAVADIAETPTANVQLRTSFFSLGINSITSISLARVLNQKHNLQVEAADLLRHPSIARLTAFLDRRKQNPASAQLNLESVFGSDFRQNLTKKLKDQGRQVLKIRPCTPNQEALLSASTHSNQAAYQNHTLFSIRCNLKILQSAIHEMFSRHEILRTCFFASNDRQFSFAQVVLSEFEPPVKTVREGIRNFLNSQIDAIDTMVPPVFITLENSKKPQMLLSMHHALYDKQAIDIMLYEIEQICKGHKFEQAPTFDDFLAASLSIDLDAADIFWGNLLKGYVGAPILPVVDQHDEGNMDTISQTLEVRHDQIEAAAKQFETTILSICQAAWAITLSFLVDENDVCFGNAVSGRTIDVKQVDRLVAPCFNTVPVRVDLTQMKMPKDIVKHLHDTNTTSLQHQFTPLRWVQNKWSTEGERLIDSMFLLQGAERLLDQDIWSLQLDVGDMGIPVICEVTPHPDSKGVDCTLHFEKSVLSHAMGNQVLEFFQDQLKWIVGLKDVTCNAVDLIPDLAARVHEAKKEALKPFQDALKEIPGTSMKKSPSGLSSKSELLRFQKRQKSPTVNGPEAEEQIEYDEAEATIKKVLVSLSRVPERKVTKQQSIFQLGLDSISAIQIAKALRSHGYRANAEDVLANPTILRLAAFLREGQMTSPNAMRVFDFDSFDASQRARVLELSSIKDKDVKSIMPCTAVQAGIVAQFRHTQGAVYFNEWTFQFDEAVDIERLMSAWQEIAKKHDILRTAFFESGSSRHPFLAICYSTTALGRLKGCIKRESPVPDKASVHDTAKQSVLNNAEIPPWRVQISSSDGHQYLHFSALHALFDAKVLNLLFKDLWRAFKEQQLSPPTSPTAAASIMLSGASDEDGKHKNFWTKHLGKAAPCRFPNLAPERQLTRELGKSTTISRYSTTKIRRKCQELDITLQAALQGAYTKLLSMYTGDPGVTFGIVLSGRDEQETINAAFPTAVTLPFYAEWYDKSEDLLKHVMNYNGLVRAHQFSPLTDIHRWLDAGNASLFDCILVLQEPGELGNEDFVLIKEEGTAEYAVSLEVIPLPNDQIEFSLIYWNDILPQQHAEMILQQFDYLLADLIQLGPAKFEDRLQSVQLPQCPLLDTDVTYMHEFAERTAQKQPEKRALEFTWELGKRPKRQSWTYAELETQANKVANFLLNLKIPAESIVAICFEKCPEASFATFGILKAGSGFVAIDSGAPIARKAFIAKDSKAAAVLTMSSLANELREELNVPVLALDEIDLASCSSDKPDISKQVNGESTCYCLYTSGSTGTPKGCLISHHNAVQGLLAFKHIFKGRYTPNSRWLQFASFHFDVSVLEQFWSWMVGICVISAPRDILFEDLPGSLNSLEVTHLDLTPSLARLITPEQVPSLCNGVFITGGEQLRQEVLDTWGDTGVIHNFYGPSECTIGVTVNQGVGKNGRPSNIGRQFINVGTCVLKPETFESVLTGAPGELCLYGPLVGKGYLNRPELSEERFPFTDRFGQRIYRTGDLVRVLHNGSFDFLGRIDDQVKLRGQRLELGEINSAVRKSSTLVTDSHSLVLKDQKRQTEQIVLFVVFDDDRIKSEADSNALERTILDQCKSSLPPYMIPSQIVRIIKAFPLTPNNKADAKALRAHFERLPKHSSSNDDSLKSHKALSGPEEHAIARVLAEYLKFDQNILSGSTNMFQAGLDSISVFNFVRALRSEGYEGASTSVVMQSKTISELAQNFINDNPTGDGLIMEAKQAISACQHRYRSLCARTLHIDRADIETIAPCTPLQQGMIARSMDVTAGGDCLYLNTFTFELMGGMDLGRLRSAWLRLLRNVPILRSKFVETNEGHVQVVVIDNNEVTDAIIKTSLVESSGSPLQDPLKVTLQDDCMTIRIFHALYDAISFNLILDGLAFEYCQKVSPAYGPSFFEALPYGPLKTAKGAKQFWEDHLKQARVGTLPNTAEKDSIQTRSKSAELKNLTNFESIRRKLGVTHQAIVQTCWIATLQTFLRSATTIGMLVSGRSIDFDSPDRIIGPMFNTLPFFAALTKDETFASAANKSHQYNVDTLPYQHTALHDITRWSQSQGRRPLFNTLFVFQKAEKTEETDVPAPWKLVEGNAAADYPLAFEAEQVDDETLKVQIVSLLSNDFQDVSEQLLDAFKNALEAMLSDPTQRLEDVFGPNFVEGCHHNLEGPQQDSNNISTTSADWSNLDSHQRLVAEELALASGVELSSIAPETSVFELGLDSIDVIKLSARLKRRNINLPMSIIMREQSVSRISSHIQDTLNVEDEDNARIEQEQHKAQEQLDNYVKSKLSDAASVESVLPVTPLQEAMIAEMHASSYDHYFNHDVLQLGKGVDLNHLKTAWETVVQSNPILRTTFVVVEDAELDDSFAQVVHKQNTSFWTTTKLPLQKSDRETFEQYTLLHRKAAAFAKNTPPFYIAVVQLPEQICLVLSIAHALYDGYSLGLLHHDVQNAYYGNLFKRPSYEPVLNRMTSSTNSKAKSFWKDFIEDAQPCEFPQTGYPERVFRHEMASQTTSEALQEFCKAQHITPQALAYTCWTFNVASYATSLDIVTGLVLSGRDDEASQDVLFPMMNTVAMRSVIHGSISDMLQYSQSTLADVTEHQHFPLRKIQALASGRQLFNSIFIFQRRPATETVGEKLYKSLEGDSNIEYPVAVELEVSGDDIVWRAACSSDCLSDSGTKELLGNLDSVLQRIIASPSASAVQYGAAGASVCDLPSFRPATYRDTASPATDEGYSSDKASMNTNETAVCEILSAVSHVPIAEITKAHTLFHLGLDSISAIKVCSLLRSQKSLKISVSSMLRAGTVELIARAATAAESDSQQSLTKTDSESAVKHAMSQVNIQSRLQEQGIDSNDVEDILPATPGQTHMLSVWLNSGGGLLYSTFEFRLVSTRTQDSVRSAWNRLVAATPVLRTCFISTSTNDLAFMQVIFRAGHRSKSQTTPLVHFTTDGEGDSVKITLRIHHALYDAVSLKLILDELVSLCADESSSPSWNSSSASLTPFIAHYVTEAEQQNRKAFWDDYLKDVSLHSSPVAERSFFPRLSLYKPSLFSFSRSQQLTNIARSNGLSVQSVFLGLLSKAYADLMDADTGKSILIGVHLANRTTEETASLAAPTLNLLPVLARKPRDVALFDLAGQLQQDLHTIGANGSISQSQLWEVQRQTGAQVDVFVNFLPLQEDDTPSPRGIELQRLNGQITEGTFSNTEAEAPPVPEQDKACLAALRGARQAASYTPYLDVEAAIRPNSGLDCGLFGPEHLIGGGVAEKFMEHLSAALHNLVK